jgi:hypothetical protein
MKQLVLFILLIVSLNALAQLTISGRVLDSETRETLIAAHYSDSLSKKSTVTNSQGFYCLTLLEGKVALKVHYVGYELGEIEFYLKKDTIIDVYLCPKNELINEVKVVAEIPIHEQTMLGKNVVSVKAIENGPSSFGESDLMKAITALPGISTGREGRSNIYVRGGDQGQNLILLDGAKLYNTGHIGGFVSLFNTDAIKQVDVYKGGFPARFGDRASSIIDIYSRDGDRNKISGKFNMGLLTSGVLVEGPISNKISFLVAARTSYYDLFTLNQRRNMRLYSMASLFTFNIHDVNAKLSYFVNPRTKLFVNYFNGADHYISKERCGSSSSSSVNYDIYNSCITIGNYTTIGPKVFLRNSATFSTYKNELDQSTVETDDEVITVANNQSSSEINEYNLQSKLEYYHNSHQSIKTGIEYSNYRFNPGSSISFNSESNTGYELDTTLGYSSLLQANEFSLFAEDEISLSNNFFVNIGMREVLFLCQNKNYYRTEPRLSIRMMLNKNLSFKASYTIMNQFSHVLISNYGIFEKEIWLTSTNDIPPQHAQQSSVGMFASITLLKIQFSTELYYKTMSNLLEYQMPVGDDIVISDLDEMIVKGGSGEAYGAEFQTKYKNDTYSIDLSYVLSWNYRQFDELNNGKRYPFIYDRRHQFSLLFTSILGKHYLFNANFVFSTGTPCTLPDSYVTSNDYMYGYYAYSGFNNSRMPNYHRLDLALIKNGITHKGREKSFKINIFNAYAHKNPVIIYYDQDTGKVYGKSMFSIVPTISYSLKF